MKNDMDRLAVVWLVGVLVLAALVARDVQAAANFNIERVTVLETGEPYTIQWCNADGQTDDSWTVTIEVMEFPPKDQQVPIASVSRAANLPSIWTWTPERAGAYWVRANSCQGDTCSAWGQSTGQEETPGCATTATAFIYYVKLRAPTGGGID